MREKFEELKERYQAVIDNENEVIGKLDSELYSLQREKSKLFNESISQKDNLEFAALAVTKRKMDKVIGEIDELNENINYAKEQFKRGPKYKKIKDGLFNEFLSMRTHYWKEEFKYNDELSIMKQEQQKILNEKCEEIYLKHKETFDIQNELNMIISNL